MHHYTLHLQAHKEFQVPEKAAIKENHLAESQSHNETGGEYCTGPQYWLKISTIIKYD